MNICNFFQFINILNPTTRGRQFITRSAIFFGAMPPDGVYKIDSNIYMYLTMSDFIDQSIYFRSYETLCKRELLRNLKSTSVFLDIGANIGYYSLLAKKVVGDKGRVIAFEPNPNTLNIFRKNIAINNCHEIELFDIALSDREGEVMLYQPIGKTHGETSMRDQGWEHYDVYKVLSKRLDNILPNNLSQIDLIKMDVEGAESLVIAGAENTLKSFQPSILFEINKVASRNFGFDTFNALHAILDIYPHYKIIQIDTHFVRDVKYQDLIKSNISNTNLLLIPIF